MKIGKTNIALPFYAAVAFALAILGQTILCGALLGFVIIVEQDSWLNRQVVQALLLAVTGSVVSVALSTINIIGSIPLIGVVASAFNSIVNGLVGLLILIFAIVAIVNVSKGKEAGVPVFNKIAEKVCN